MELDDLKNTWNRATNNGLQQHSLTKEKLEQLQDQKFRSKIRNITVSERMGSIVCLGAAAYIGFRFDQLDTLFLQGAGATALILLIVLPLISYQSTLHLGQSFRLDHSYAANLQAFALQKIRFTRLQKWNAVLGYLLLVAVIILIPGFFGGNNLADNKYFWILAFTIGYIFVSFYARWVEKYYRKSLIQAEELLKELSN